MAYTPSPAGRAAGSWRSPRVFVRRVLGSSSSSTSSARLETFSTKAQVFRSPLPLTGEALSSDDEEPVGVSSAGAQDHVETFHVVETLGDLLVDLRPIGEVDVAPLAHAHLGRGKRSTGLCLGHVLLLRSPWQQERRQARAPR